MNPLVSTDWLAARLDDADIAVLDATWFMPGAPRDAGAEYAERHIPGAGFFDIDKVCDLASDLPHMLALLHSAPPPEPVADVPAIASAVLRRLHEPAER